MNKGTRKKIKIDRARATAIAWVAQKHAVDPSYVRKSLSGDRTGGITEDLIRDFRGKYAELQKVLSL